MEIEVWDVERESENVGAALSKSPRKFEKAEINLLTAAKARKNLASSLTEHVGGRISTVHTKHNEAKQWAGQVNEL